MRKHASCSEVPTFPKSLSNPGFPDIQNTRQWALCLWENPQCSIFDSLLQDNYSLIITFGAISQLSNHSRSTPSKPSEGATKLGFRVHHHRLNGDSRLPSPTRPRGFSWPQSQLCLPSPCMSSAGMGPGHSQGFLNNLNELCGQESGPGDAAVESLNTLSTC